MFGIGKMSSFLIAFIFSVKEEGITYFEWDEVRHLRRLQIWKSL